MLHTHNFMVFNKYRCFATVTCNNSQSQPDQSTELLNIIWSHSAKSSYLLCLSAQQVDTIFCGVARMWTPNVPCLMRWGRQGVCIFIVLKVQLMNVRHKKHTKCGRDTSSHCFSLPSLSTQIWVERSYVLFLLRPDQPGGLQSRLPRNINREWALST